MHRCILFLAPPTLARKLVSHSDQNKNARTKRQAVPDQKTFWELSIPYVFGLNDCKAAETFLPQKLLSFSILAAKNSHRTTAHWIIDMPQISQRGEWRRNWKEGPHSIHSCTSKSLFSWICSVHPDFLTFFSPYFFTFLCTFLFSASYDTFLLLFIHTPIFFEFLH